MKAFTLDRRSFLAGATTLLLPGVARAQAGDTLSKIRSKGVLVIGNGGAYPPFEYMENGQLTGYDRDLGEELGKRLGVKTEWVVSDFAGLIPGLTSGRTDIIISALTRTPEREARIAFTKGYYKTGIAAAYRSEANVVKPEDLVGKIVGVQAGTAGEKFTRDQFADKVKDLKVYPEFPLALRDLAIGRVEAVVNTMPVLRYNLVRNNMASLKVSDVWDARDIGMNTRLNDTELLAELDRQIAEMQKDGFIESLNKKWFAGA